MEPQVRFPFQENSNTQCLNKRKRDFVLNVFSGLPFHFSEYVHIPSMHVQQAMEINKMTRTQYCLQKAHLSLMGIDRCLNVGDTTINSA